VADPKLTQLFTLARQGSAQALGEVLQSCRGYLLAIAERELDPELRAKGGASDLVQETFLKAQGQFASFRGTTEAEWRGWLRQILRNNLADFSRGFRDSAKRCVDREVGLAGTGSAPGLGAALPAEETSPSQHVLALELAAQLEQALAGLPEEYRRVLQYRYQEQRSFEEIAGLMQVTPNAARKLWLRAIQKLRQGLDQPGADTHES
jgi:RNA polymerase sigma-70 factor (ECF subfamily)